FRIYYAPNNAVLSIAGDVNTADCLARVRKFFESIPSQPAPPPVEAVEPPQTAERRQTVDDPLARLPRVGVVSKIPPSSHPDHDALDVLSQVLSGGRSSRFYEAVVRQKQLSPGIFAGTEESRGPALFAMGGTVSPGKTAADLEAALFEEIDKVSSSLVD